MTPRERTAAALVDVVFVSTDGLMLAHKQVEAAILAALAEQAEAHAKALAEVVAEIIATAREDEQDDKDACGKNYDHNSYGSGFNAGIIGGARAVLDAIRARTP